MTAALSAELTFVDTNVLVYAHDRAEGRKHEIAGKILRELWEAKTGLLSTQVLQEFYVVATRKLDPAVPWAQARRLVADYGEWCTLPSDPQLIVSASMLEETHQLSWWDALIVEAAMRSGASTLLTEDLQDGQRFGTLVVRNPFAGG